MVNLILISKPLIDMNEKENYRIQRLQLARNLKKGVACLPWLRDE